MRLNYLSEFDRESILNCPRCMKQLTTGSYADQPVKLCLICNGILIDQKNLSAVLAKLAESCALIIDINSKIRLIPDKGSIGNCPECDLKTDYYGYMESNLVMIDFCTACNWLWIDTTELQAMAKMYAKFQKIKTHIDMTHRHVSTDLVGAHMDAEIAAKAFLSAFVM